MYQLLLELKDRLNQIAIIGLQSIPEDFRLKKLQERLKQLSSKAPVLEKLYELVTKLLEGKEIVAHYFELNHLVDAILRTQGNSGVEGEVQEVEVYKHKSLKALSYQQIKSVRKILDGGTIAKWIDLKQAYDYGKLIDYRLLHLFIKHIDESHVYREVGAFSIITILKAYGKDIVPILIKGFDGLSTNGKVNVITIISELVHEECNDYYLKWFEEAEDESITIVLLKALSDLKDNETILLDFKTRKKKVQEARVLALAKIGTKTAIEEVKRCCLKDANLFIKICETTSYLSEDEVFKYTKEVATGISRKNLKGIMLERTSNYKVLKYLLKYIQKYETNKVLKVCEEIMTLGLEKQGCCFEERLNIHLIGYVLLQSNEPQKLNFLLQCKDKYGAYYIKDSFIAALKCYDKKKVYDEFVRDLPSDLYLHIQEVIKVIEQHNIDVRYNTRSRYCLEDIREAICTIKVDAMESVELVVGKICWDKRWIDYVEQNGDKDLRSFFIIQCRNELEKKEQDKVREEYIRKLEGFRARCKQEEYRPFIEGKRNPNAERVLQEIISILLVVDGREVAIRQIPFFVHQLYLVQPLLLKYLKEEELGLMDTEIDKKGKECFGIEKNITSFIEGTKRFYRIQYKLDK